MLTGPHRVMLVLTTVPELTEHRRGTLCEVIVPKTVGSGQAAETPVDVETS